MRDDRAEKEGLGGRNARTVFKERAGRIRQGRADAMLPAAAAQRRLRSLQTTVDYYPSDRGASQMVAHTYRQTLVAQSLHAVLLSVDDDDAMRRGLKSKSFIKLAPVAAADANAMCLSTPLPLLLLLPTAEQ